MLRKDKIKQVLNKESYSLKFNIPSVQIPIGVNDSINNFILTQNGQSINNVNDGEKYIYKSRVNKSYTFEFVSNTNTYDDTLLNNGFNEADVNNGEEYVQNSFYIAQYFTSENLDNQELLHTSYLNGFSFYLNGVSTTYSNSFIKNTEFNTIFLSENFINTQVNNVFYIYVRYYFYNSLNGSVLPLFNKDKESSPNSDRLFVPVTIRKSDRTFILQSNTTNLKLKEINSNNYRNKLKDQVTSLERRKSNPPQGTAFLPTGDYEIID